MGIKLSSVAHDCFFIEVFHEYNSRGNSRVTIFAPLNEMVILPVSIAASYTVAYGKPEFLPFFCREADETVKMSNFFRDLSRIKNAKNVKI